MFKIFGTAIGMSHPFEKDKLCSVSLITISCLRSGLVLCMCVRGIFVMLGIKPRALCQASAVPPSYSCSPVLGLSALRIYLPQHGSPLYITHPRLLCPGLLDRRKANYSTLYTRWNVSIPSPCSFYWKRKKNPNIRTCQVLIWVKRKRKKSQLGCHDLRSDGWLSCKRNNQKPELPRSMTGLLSRHRQKQEREEWSPQEVGLAG